MARPRGFRMMDKDIKIMYLVTWGYSHNIYVKKLNVKETPKCYMVDHPGGYGRTRYTKAQGIFSRERWFDNPDDALKLANELHVKFLQEIEEEKTEVIARRDKLWGLKNE